MGDCLENDHQASTFTTTESIPQRLPSQCNMNTIDCYSDKLEKVERLLTLHKGLGKITDPDERRILLKHFEIMSRKQAEKATLYRILKVRHKAQKA